jgi:hypothetical protein
VLASGTPNDGSQEVAVPYSPTATARVKVEAADNVFFDLSDEDFTITPPTDVAALTTAPSGLALYGGSPNPFSRETAINFDLPRPGDALLQIYDLTGRLVRTLVHGPIRAGRHQAFWDGTNAGGRPVSSGVYLYQLSAMGETLTGRLTLLR